LTVPSPKLRTQFWQFLAAGGVAAAANFASRFVFSLWMHYELAIVMAYLVGLIVAFVLMRSYVFTASGKPLGKQASLFVAVNCVALLQTLVVSVALNRWVLPYLGVVSQSEAIAHFVGVSTPVVTSYFGHRMLTFS
jgi:putative flippase GtrA